VNRSDRILLGAAGLSAGLHLIVLFGVPGFQAATLEPLPPPAIAVRIEPRPPAAPIVKPDTPRAAVSPAPRRAAPPPRAARKVQTSPEPLREAVVRTDDAPILDIAPPSFAESEPVGGSVAGAAEPIHSATTADGEPLAEAPPPPEYPLRSARLVFDLYYGATATKVGQVIHTWAQDGAHYRVESVAEAVGFVSLFLGGRFVQRSTGALDAGGLLPSEYRAEATARERSQLARFDWVSRKLSLADRDTTRLVDLPDGAQDPLSMVHQLWFMQPMPAAARLDIATGRKLYEQVYRVVGETQFETPAGLVRALHLSRRDADGERMDVWLDLDRDLLPARIHFVDRKGLVLEQVIREARVAIAAGR
jgi:hypothetical protein